MEKFNNQLIIAIEKNDNLIVRLFSTVNCCYNFNGK